MCRRCARRSWSEWEIEWRALDSPQFSSRNQVLVHRREAVGIDHDFMIQNVARAFACEIEIAVLAHVDRRALSVVAS